MNKTSWLAAALLLCMTPMASASVAFDLGLVYTGDTPSGSAPWLRLEFENTATPDEVKLTITSLVQHVSQFISDVYFNFESGLAGVDSDDLDIDQLTGPAATSDTGDDDQGGLGGPLFDVQISFDQSNGPNSDRFNGLDVATFSIKGTGVDETDFDVLSASNNSNIFKAVAHLQGIPGGGSAKIAEIETEVVPEPASLAVWGCIGLMGIPYGIYRRRKAVTA